MEDGNTYVDTNACADEPCDLYRFYDAGGRLLYVGISKQLPVRWRNHGQFKSWWPDVARATIEHYESRDAAAEAEIRAIVTERPAYNVKDAPKPPPAYVRASAPEAVDYPTHLGVAEAAKLLRVSPDTVRRWERSGVLVPALRLPKSGHRRYDRAEVVALQRALDDPSQGVERTATA